MNTVTEVCLNLGSRDRALEGFLSMDCDQHPGVDIVGDVSDLSRFVDNSVDKILASHVLEHFPHPKTLSVLKEWFRVIKKGGALYVAVPDFKRGMEIYQNSGLLTDWLQDWICGNQDYKTAFHYSIFDENRLRKILLQVGFSEATRISDFPFGNRDCSTLISTFDNLPVSLNFVAIKR